MHKGANRSIIQASKPCLVRLLQRYVFNNALLKAHSGQQIVLKLSPGSITSLVGARFVSVPLFGVSLNFGRLLPMHTTYLRTYVLVEFADVVRGNLVRCAFNILLFHPPSICSETNIFQGCSGP